MDAVNGTAVCNFTVRHSEEDLATVMPTYLLIASGNIENGNQF
jgi:hypothetical protein